MVEFIDVLAQWAKDRKYDFDIHYMYDNTCDRYEADFDIRIFFNKVSWGLLKLTICVQSDSISIHVNCDIYECQIGVLEISDPYLFDKIDEYVKRVKDLFDNLGDLDCLKIS